MTPKRRPNHRLVKIHRSYTVDEAARLFTIHKNTVRIWIKEGLPLCDGSRPLLILGCDLAAFLQARRTKNKRPCGPCQMYCVRCREPRIPAGAMADYEPKTETLGNLVGICPECGIMMYRRVSTAMLPLFGAKLSITILKVP